jgi:hypothetical protein
MTLEPLGQSGETQAQVYSRALALGQSGETQAEVGAHSLSNPAASATANSPSGRRVRSNTLQPTSNLPNPSASAEAHFAKGSATVSDYSE